MGAYKLEEEKRKIITISLHDTELWEKFRIAAKEQASSRSARLEELIQLEVTDYEERYGAIKIVNGKAVAPEAAMEELEIDEDDIDGPDEDHYLGEEID